MKIRAATMLDLNAITAVEAECFPKEEAAAKNIFAARLSVYPDHFWLLLDEEKLIGFVNGMVSNEPHLQDEMYRDAKMHDEKGKWQIIFGVDTIPAYRRKGCAEKVIKQVISDAQSQNRLGIVLTCKERLIPYYSKFGFINEGVSESIHGGAVWYEMRLTF